MLEVFIMNCQENLEFGFAKVFILFKGDGYVRLLCKELLSEKTRLVDVYDDLKALLPVTNW